MTTELTDDEGAYLANHSERCQCGHLEAFHAHLEGFYAHLWDNEGGRSTCLICSCPYNAAGYTWQPGDTYRLKTDLHGQSQPVDSSPC